MAKQLGLDQAKSLVLLTAGLVMAATLAVAASGWTQGLGVITFVGAGSILIGLMIARSILPGIIAHIFSIIIGIGWSFWVTARLLPAHYSWMDRWENLAIRLNSWYELARQGGTSYDNLMFILQMSVIVWCMGYLTVWFIFRSGRVWQAIIPAGVVLMMNLYYAPSDITFWFLVYLLLSLIVVIRFNTLRQEAVWRAEGVFFRPDVSFDLLRDGIIFSALVIAVAWLTPPVVDAKAIGLFDEFEGNWHDVQDVWNRMYADLNYRNPTSTAGTFGQSFALGGARVLTDEPVMDVKVEGIGRYWRATVYDEYNGIGWRNTLRETISFNPATEVTHPIYAARHPITQTFTMYRESTNVLYAMAGVMSLNRTARVTYNALTNQQALQTNENRWAGNGAPFVEDITYIRSNAAVDRGETYTAVSASSQASISQLRRAGTEYPAWVRERYLQLPPITDRTRDLALRITGDYSTPFDKAQAIERYMRNNINYNERIAPPPPGVDKVDYILFDLKEAYCDYYATSMITMLRSVGIPARMAAGFARGTFDSEREVFHVINADAHSWVEVYFPEYGWIEFEPTAAQPTIIRAIGTDDRSFASGAFPNPDERPDGGRPGEDDLGQFDDAPFGDGLFEEDTFLSFNLPLFGNRVSISRTAVGRSVSGFGLLVVVGVIVLAVWWRRLQQYASRSIFNLYEGMLRLGHWMGVSLQSWQTPFEHAQLLQQQLPSYQHEVETITKDFVHHTFSPPPSKGHLSQTIMTSESKIAWRRIQPEMVKVALKRLLSWKKHN